MVANLMQAEEGHLLKLSSNQGWDPRIQVAECGDLVRAYLIKTERFLLVYDTLLGPKSGRLAAGAGSRVRRRKTPTGIQ